MATRQVKVKVLADQVINILSHKLQYSRNNGFGDLKRELIRPDSYKV